MQVGDDNDAWKWVKKNEVIDDNSFTNWADDEPNDEKCAIFNTEQDCKYGEWLGLNCGDHDTSVICQALYD